MGIGKWVKKGAVSFIMATGGVEKNALSQSGEDSDAGQLSAIPMGQNQLMRDLKEGRIAGKKIYQIYSNQGTSLFYSSMKYLTF